MPPRVHRTPEQALEREDVRREQNRVAKQRSRARQRDAARVPVTGQQDGAAREGASVSMTDPSLVVSSSLTRLFLTREEGVPAGVAVALEPFRDRGYAPDARFWTLVVQRYPELDLELEALKLADWLDQPKNAKRRCTKAFLHNWMRKADADRKAGPPPRPSRNGVAHDPPAPARRRDPSGVTFGGTLSRIDLTQAQRDIEARRAVPFAERLAQARGGTR